MSHYDFERGVSRQGTYSAKYASQGIIPLSVADMDFPAPKGLVDQLARFNEKGIYGYTLLSDTWMQTVSTWFREKHHWHINEEDIVFCPRIIQAISLYLQFLTRPDDKIVALTPSYSPITDAVTLNKRQLLTSPLHYQQGQYTIDFVDLEEKCEQASCLILISPHNPTGRVWTKEELSEISRITEKHNVFIICDEIHSDFVFSPHQFVPFHTVNDYARNHSMICTSPSKSFNLPGLEITNLIISNPEIRLQMQNVLKATGFHNPNYFAVPALMWAYQHGKPWLSALIEKINQNKKWVIDQFAYYFPEWIISDPQGTYLLWVDYRSSGLKEEQLKAWFVDRAKVAVSFGSDFGEQGEGFFRLNSACPQNNLELALQKIIRHRGDNKMIKNETPRAKRMPSLFEALLPIIVMVLLLGFGYVMYGLPSEPLMIISTVVAGFLALRLGYTYNEILSSISHKISQAMPALLIVICVGLLIGTWMASGTIPLMVYYGLRLISPQFIYLTALLVTAIVSVCTGTSWGSAGTIGVAFMGVAMGMHANLAATAGAVVAGAYFGDKISPLSGDTNLAAMSAGIDLYEHMAHLLYTTFPSLVLTAIVVTIYGLTGSHVAGSTDTVKTITDLLAGAYHFNLILLIPIIIVLYGAFRKKPTIPIMLLSGIVAMAEALWVQHFSLLLVIKSAVDGFNVSMLHHPVPHLLDSLLNRGGMNSMMGTLLICFCALSFAGALSISGALTVIVNNLLKLVHSTGSLIVATLVCGIIMIAVTCNGQISLIMPIEMLRNAYVRRGLHPKNLSRSAEDSGTIFEPILPWTAAGAYMTATLGVATIHYMPWAILCWSGVLFAILWGFTGIGIAKLTPEEQAAFMKSDLYNSQSEARDEQVADFMLNKKTSRN